MEHPKTQKTAKFVFSRLILSCLSSVPKIMVKTVGKYDLYGTLGEGAFGK
jgi:hypothetical protein